MCDNLRETLIDLKADWQWVCSSAVSKPCKQSSHADCNTKTNAGNHQSITARWLVSYTEILKTVSMSKSTSNLITWKPARHLHWNLYLPPSTDISSRWDKNIQVSMLQIYRGMLANSCNTVPFFIKGDPLPLISSKHVQCPLHCKQSQCSHIFTLYGKLLAPGSRHACWMFERMPLGKQKSKIVGIGRKKDDLA